MRNNFTSLVMTGSILAGGLITGVASVEAATLLAPGKLSVVSERGAFFVNNVIDFTPGSPAAFGPSPGTPGTGNVTTPPTIVDPEGGIFGSDPLPDGRQFVSAPVLFEDLFLPASVIPGGSFLTDVEYNFGDFLPPGSQEFTFLRFDTNGDGFFGDQNDDDFEYIITGFTRRVQQGTTGGFDVSFDFQGFFRDHAGIYADTPSVLSIFNGTSSFNPDDLVAVETLAQYALLGAGGLGGRQFSAAIDGTITTAEAVPEPGMVVSMIGLVGFLGLAKKNKKSEKQTA